MGNKIMKKGFGLFVVMLLVFVFSSVSLFIIETKMMDENIDKYKYFHLQSKLHLEYVKEYIIKNKSAPPWDANATRYELTVIPSNDNKIFDIFIEHQEDINVRLHQRLYLSK